MCGHVRVVRDAQHALLTPPQSTGQVETFQDMLDNIFSPLFEVTRDPASNPALHAFLSQVVGFDCVDDESKAEGLHNRSLPPPDEWDLPLDPPFSYWLYYMHANLATLNRFRESRGMSTFSFRPHAGEAGDINHMVAAFLVSEHVCLCGPASCLLACLLASACLPTCLPAYLPAYLPACLPCAPHGRPAQINHGITMRKSAPLQYLYYLTQIGLAMAPLSNNKLFVDYHRNPFFSYFARGLNVSLSTDDPLLLHYTKVPSPTRPAPRAVLIASRASVAHRRSRWWRSTAWRRRCGS